MSISGRRELIWRTREISSGWQMDDRLHSQIGMQASQIISVMRMARRRIVWNFGIAMVKDSNGTIRHVVLKHILSVKCNNCFHARTFYPLLLPIFKIENSKIIYEQQIFYRLFAFHPQENKRIRE
jgi:hypothetical protein